MKLSKKQLGLGSKAKIVFSVIAVIFIATTGGAYYGINQVDSVFERVMSQDVRLRDRVRALQNDMLLLRRYEKDYFRTLSEDYFQKHQETYTEARKRLEEIKAIPVSYSSELNYKELEDSLQGYDKYFLEYAQGLKDIGDHKSGHWSEILKSGESLEKILSQDNVKINALAYTYFYVPSEESKAALIQGLSYSKDLFSDLEGNAKASSLEELQSIQIDLESIFKIRETLSEDEKRMRSSIHSFEARTTKILDIVIEKTRSTQAETLALGRTVENSLMAIAAVGLILVLSFSIYFARVIKNIVGLSEKLQLSSNSTEKSGHHVNDMSQKVSASVTQQASAIQETVSTLNELTAMVNRSVENAKTSSERAEDGHNVAREGKENVDAMIVAMNQINSSNKEVMDQMTQSNQEIAQIIQVINEISQKTNVINDIVFQTKLLSFNASVEAARAGEHGKGFAVVAEEVGNLAQMSGSASKEIDELLKRSIKQVESIVANTQNSVEGLMGQAQTKIDNGVSVAKKCGDSLDRVVQNVDEVMRMMNEISSASQEQAEGIHNITTAMNELDEATHSNSTVATETESCAKTLQREALELNSIVSALKLELLGAVEREMKYTLPKDQNKPRPKDKGEKPTLKIAPKQEAKKIEKELLSKEKSANIPDETDPRFKEVI